jgi:hypothetical protein
MIYGGKCFYVLLHNVVKLHLSSCIVFFSKKLNVIFIGTLGGNRIATSETNSKFKACVIHFHHHTTYCTVCIKGHCQETIFRSIAFIRLSFLGV